MKTSLEGSLLPAVHDANLMISYSEIKDGLEIANYFPLPFGLTHQTGKSPAEHLEEQVSESHLPVYVLPDLGTLTYTYDQCASFLI